MDNNRSYILYMFVFGLVVPLIVIVASYVSILRVVKKVFITKSISFYPPFPSLLLWDVTGINCRNLLRFLLNKIVFIVVFFQH